MKVKQSFHASYKTHGWCSREGKWVMKTIPESYFCECGNRLRKTPRAKGFKDETRWDRAY